MRETWRRGKTKWEPIAGIVLGLLVWVYDHQFFANAGGAPAPISHAILVATQFQSSGPLVYLFWPGFVLAGLGGVVGFFASLLRTV